MHCTAGYVRKHTLAIQTYGFSFADQLADGVSLTGTPAVSISPDGELTASGISIPGTDWQDDQPGDAFDAGEGITMQLSGGVVDETYVVTIIVDTTSGATLARTWRVRIYRDCY